MHDLNSKFCMQISASVRSETDFAHLSASSFPRMPTWLGSQQKTIFLSVDISLSFMSSLRMCGLERLTFLLTVKLTKSQSLTAWISAVKIEDSGCNFCLSLCNLLIEAQPTYESAFEPFV